jgi:hypothetical protein
MYYNKTWNLNENSKFNLIMTSATDNIEKSTLKIKEMKILINQLAGS